MGRKSVIIVTLVLIAAIRTSAQSGPSTFEFIENKGQWDSRVKFKGEMPSGDFYLHQNGFTVVQFHTDDLFKLLKRHHGLEDEKGSGGAIGLPGRVGKPKNPSSDPSKINSVRAHAYRVQFVNSNESSEVLPDKLVDANTNYFIGNDPSKWARKVRTFQAVTYRDVYPNIDVRYYTEGGRLKYDIIVHPGGDVNKILMRYEGADKLTIKNRELIIKTSVGDLKELYPYSYQFDNVKGKTEVSASYELVDSKTVRFRVSNYSRTSTLIIDPTLIFCSFTGSRAGQWGFTATPGPDGSLYSGGIVFGSGFPTNNGAFQESFKGGEKDIGIFKFTANGRARAYATYIGGNGNDYPHSLICDPQGNLIMMGRSYSTNYPGNAELADGGGDGDIVVTKLNADGSDIIGSLRIGGSGQDGVNISDQQQGGASATPRSTMRFYGDDSRSEVQLDAAGNIYVAAQTKSSSFPKTTGRFQQSSAGKQDGVVIKINPTCTAITWASFIGGEGDDGAFVISVRPGTNEIYVAGATNSRNVAYNKTGAYQSGYQGGNSDAFMARISNDGSTLINWTYMGTPLFDAIFGIQFDRNTIPYIMGTSEGRWPVQNAAWSVPNSKQFIAKVRPDLSGFIYSTVYGSGANKPNISPVAFLVDRCENVYVSGWGGWIAPNSTSYNMAGTVGMPTTPDAIKSVTDDRDMYFIVIRKDASALLYGTFFGQSGGEGEHVDGGTSRYDEEGVIYQAICANCFGSSQYPITSPFPTTPGVWGPMNGTNGENCDLAVVKLAFNFSGVGSGPRVFIEGALDTVGCVPFVANFRDTVRNAKKYIWNFGDGSPDTVTTDFNVSHTYYNVGTYVVRLIGIDSTSCNIADTAYVTLHARDDEALLGFDMRKVGDCDALNYEFTNLSTPPAGRSFHDQSFIWDFGDGTRVTTGLGAVTHPYNAPGPYKVKLILADTGFCNSPDSVFRDFNIAANVVARIQVDTPGCAPYTAQFFSASSGGHDFMWYFPDGTTSTDMNPEKYFENTGEYTIKLVVTDTNTCNKVDSTTFTLKVHPKPFAEFNTTPVPAQNNTPTVFHNLSTGGTRYKWLFGDGDSTISNTMDTVMHQYNETGTFTAYLITFNQFGCTDTADHEVQALITPLLDVPNAFTPGRFGQNSTIRVHGFGIGRMTWRIYNRWGQVVYESNNRKSGWDGTYKGQPQPMDVYAYTLDVEFTDGTRLRKTGDITLVR